MELLGAPYVYIKMNPMERTWKQLRSMGFKSKVFKCFDHVVDRLYDTLGYLTHEMIQGMACRQ